MQQDFQIKPDFDDYLDEPQKPAGDQHQIHLKLYKKLRNNKIRTVVSLCLGFLGLFTLILFLVLGDDLGFMMILMMSLPTLSISLLINTINGICLLSVDYSIEKINKMKKKAGIFALCFLIFGPFASLIFGSKSKKIFINEMRMKPELQSLLHLLTENMKFYNSF